MDKGIESMDRARIEGWIQAGIQGGIEKEIEEGLLVGKPYVAKPYLAFVILFCVS
jgi:hypothetical protein